ncbi:MAG: molybdenum cofactor biosynthesis protein MoaE [Campylobacteraceae bacterium]|jgi:molybdopterin synthase catalytic subunit|nr:molybdenum cofactor biosynthesis protein MoaE [Campylobacteraceae bacterium]
MVEIYDGSLDIESITSSWYKACKDKNHGAFVTFIGIVRDENEIEGLSFDIYEPVLQKWFNDWQERLRTKNAVIFMAHSRGDVLNHTSSFAVAIASPKRRVALEMIDKFVEDFKSQAPIWKYDLKNGKKVYAKERSIPLPAAGILK